jgi:hypothetical protein
MGVIHRLRPVDATRLNVFLPTYHVANYHKKRCDASSQHAFQAIETLSFRDIPFSINLIFIRTLLLKILKREFKEKVKFKHDPKSTGRAILDFKPDSEWLILDHVLHKHIIIGVIGSFWKTSPELISANSSPEEFKRFDKAGFAKAVLCFRIIEHEHYCEIELETKVLALDPKSRKNLRLYWALIAPGMWFIRKMWLLALKKKAEHFQYLGEIWIK